MGYFKTFEQFVNEKFKSEDEFQVYNEAMSILESVNESDEVGVFGKLGNWLFIAPKIKRLMNQANAVRLDRVDVEYKSDEAVRKYNIEFEKELDDTRDKWKKIIKEAPEEKKDRFRETLADKIENLRKDHKIKLKDIEGEFDRKTEALDDQIKELENEAQEIAGQNDYLNKIRRTVRLKGLIDADKAKLAVATGAEAENLEDKIKEYKKEIELQSAEIRDIVTAAKKETEVKPQD